MMSGFRAALHGLEFAAGKGPWKIRRKEESPPHNQMA
jgi:hypothetical protein